jgi:hypothetical protein
MSSTIMIHSTDKDLNLKFYTSQSVSGEPYPVLGFEVQDGYKRNVSLSLFPSFAQVQEIYNALGKYLEEVNIQKMTAEFEAKEEFTPVQKYLKVKTNHIYGFGKGEEYPILDEDDNGIIKVRDCDGDFRYFTISKMLNEFEVIEKEV